MILYPAIDLKQGRAVRLLQGREEDLTDYGDPLVAARLWRAQGAAWLHLVDLDGAFTGQSVNLPVVQSIAAGAGLKLQLGGGIRTMADIDARLGDGLIQRVILGTAALENPGLVQAACKAYPGRIACGIDARGGKVAVRGWVEQSQTDALALALAMRDAGVATIIYTDIARDGMLSGPNLEATAAMVEGCGLPVIASGGISSLADLKTLRQSGCAGAICGKALYSGQFTLAQGLAAAEA